MLQRVNVAAVLENADGVATLEALPGCETTNCTPRPTTPWGWSGTPTISRPPRFPRPGQAAPVAALAAAGVVDATACQSRDGTSLRAVPARFRQFWIPRRIICHRAVYRINRNTPAMLQPRPVGRPRQLAADAAYRQPQPQLTDRYAHTPVAGARNLPARPGLSAGGPPAGGAAGRAQFRHTALRSVSEIITEVTDEVVSGRPAGAVCASSSGGCQALLEWQAAALRKAGSPAASGRRTRLEWSRQRAALQDEFELKS
jgi:hypothetical protein